MKGDTQLNAQIKLTKVPTSDYPNKQTDIFQLKYTAPVPTDRLKDGEVIVRTEYISIDASMRTWINGQKSYTEPVKPGMVMNARTVGQVVFSKSDKFQKGDMVMSFGGWQKYSVQPAKQLIKIPKNVTNPQEFLVLGLSGLSAYFGLQNIGKIKQKQVVVISAAAGGLGQIAVQLAKAKGCIVCGIAGGPEKCKFVKQIGADYVIDYKSESVKDKLRDYFKTGIDVYFDNVGGQMLDDVLMHIKDESRIVLCGAISSYNQLAEKDTSEHYRLKNYPRLIIKRAVMKGFIVFDFVSEYPKAFKDMYDLINQGKLKIKIDMLQGLDQCPNALIRLLKGQNIGKVMVKVNSVQPKL